MENRSAIVFCTILATCTFIGAILYGVGLGVSSDLLPIQGYLGGLVPVALTALAMYIFGIVLKDPTVHEVQDGDTIHADD
jgi:uncharacterized membrane protein YiaA